MTEICLEQNMSQFQHPHLAQLPTAIPYTGEVPAKCLQRTGSQPCMGLNFPEVGEEMCHTQAVFISRTNYYSLSWESEQVNSQKNHSRKERQRVKNEQTLERNGGVPVGNTRAKAPKSLLLRSWDPEQPIPDAEYLWDPFCISHMSKSPSLELV